MATAKVLNNWLNWLENVAQPGARARDCGADSKHDGHPESLWLDQKKKRAGC
jgi:hypothetical protein